MELSDKKEEINYEKLFMNILELRQESEKSLEIFSEFFRNYIKNNESCNTTQILNFLRHTEENKKMMNISN
jgi:hypothetical protein